MICAVMVVPMLAPRMMEMACGRPMRPALTKPMAMTVVALELCSTAVATAPASTPITGFLVSSESTRRMPSPATFWSVSLIKFMP